MCAQKKSLRCSKNSTIFQTAVLRHSLLFLPLVKYFYVPWRGHIDLVERNVLASGQWRSFQHPKQQPSNTKEAEASFSVSCFLWRPWITSFKDRWQVPLVCVHVRVCMTVTVLGVRRRKWDILCVSVLSSNLCDPWTVGHQALLSVGFSRQD